jgi:23S rRNA-/tRNA-specific pseudouridylate synthase
MIDSTSGSADQALLARIDEAFTCKYCEIIIKDPEPAISELKEALRIYFPHITAESWPTRIAWGGLFINGREQRSYDYLLPYPCRIEYYEPRFDFTDPYSYFPRFSPSWILFEDETVLCSFKPVKLPSMPAREQTHYCLKQYLEQYLGHTIHMPSRLDMSTAGLLVVSKDPRYHNTLQRAYEGRRVSKHYLFETASPVHLTTADITLPIGKDPLHPVLRKPDPEGGKPAHTVFSVVKESSRGTTFVEALPKTGRTHQIRVHARYSGFPICGDNFYGGAPADTLHLLSYKVTFTHPKKQTPVTVRLPQSLTPTWALEAYDTLVER